MPAAHRHAATITQLSPGKIALSGCWTARALGDMERRLAAIEPPGTEIVEIDGSQLTSIDSIGIWVLQKGLEKIREAGSSIQLHAWPPRYQRLMEIIAQQGNVVLPRAPRNSILHRIGFRTEMVWQDTFSMFSFIGETAITLARLVLHPGQWRWRAVLHNIQIAGFDALPIVGVTAFLLGIVVAYQGADQLRHYGANIFVVDLLGYSMLREFAPLITAIIIAGRSGSSYAAQIGTMVVTEEIDAMRTIGIEPIAILVIPKIIGLFIALPLLTIFADAVGIFGGMVMAQSQLGVGFHEFIERFGKAISLSQFMIGVGKAGVFAVVIALIGCFQGFRTKGNADSVGRQTTRSVVQAIFIAIVLDAAFSVIFSLLDL
jgi:phospholipid/cholesterol/gamma-HCH transport system permease protein